MVDYSNFPFCDFTVAETFALARESKDIGDKEFVTACMEAIRLNKCKAENVCDVCGKPATHSARDVLEKPNTEKVYREFAPSTQVRYGCDNHPVTSMTYEQ